MYAFHCKTEQCQTYIHENVLCIVISVRIPQASACYPEKVEQFLSFTLERTEFDY